MEVDDQYLDDAALTRVALHEAAHVVAATVLSNAGDLTPIEVGLNTDPESLRSAVLREMARRARPGFIENASTEQLGVLLDVAFDTVEAHAAAVVFPFRPSPLPEDFTERQLIVTLAGFAQEILLGVPEEEALLHCASDLASAQELTGLGIDDLSNEVAEAMLLLTELADAVERLAQALVERKVLNADEIRSTLEEPCPR